MVEALSWVLENYRDATMPHSYGLFRVSDARESYRNILNNDYRGCDELAFDCEEIATQFKLLWG